MKPAPQHFDFCPSCGDSSVAPMHSAAIRCTACGFEFFMSPCVSAAALIEDPSGKLLVIKRKKDPSKGKLGVPGGFADPGETLEETLQREVREEVNLLLDSWSFLGGWPNQYTYKSVVYSVVDTYFVANVSQFDSLRACAEEIDGVQFVEASSIDPNEWAFPSLRNAIDRYLANKS